MEKKSRNLLIGIIIVVILIIGVVFMVNRNDTEQSNLQNNDSITENNEVLPLDPPITDIPDTPISTPSA